VLRAGAAGAAAARFVDPDVAWLGPRVWYRADIWWRQPLADAFEEGWGRAGREAADQAAGRTRRQRVLADP